MKSKIPVIIFAILLIVVLSGRVPFLNAPAIAAPRDYCDGFQNPPVPNLATDPFLLYPIPTSKHFIPIAVEDWDGDGDLDTPFASNRGSFGFQPVHALDNLIEISGYGPIIRKNRSHRSKFPTDEHYLNFHGVAVIDFDDDGLQDFIAAPYSQPGLPIMLFRNLGNWQFELSHQSYFQSLLGFNTNSDWNSETIIVADLTGDGLNDIYIPFYTHKEPYQSVFLRSTGSGFVEEAMARGLGIPNIPWELRPEGAQAVDIDNDGDLDVYVAHHLLINDGNGYFTDAREAYGLPAIFDEGVAFIDYNNDGLLDLYLRSSDPAYLLYVNTGSGFINSSVTSGLACLTQNLLFYAGDVWADFDMDEDPDLLFTFDEMDPKYALFLNQGDSTFRLGLIGDRFIDLPTLADLDFDGDLDLLSMFEADENVFLKSANAKSVAVVPVDQQGKRSEHGTTVQITNQCSGRIQTHVIGTNNVFLAQGQYAAQFSVTSGCSYQIRAIFPKRESSPRTIVDVSYNPDTEGSLKVTVRRTGAIKEPYPGYRSFFHLPDISKDGKSNLSSRP